MAPLIAAQLVVLTYLTAAQTAVRRRLSAARARGSDAGLSTLEITVIALGLFLLAGAAVAAISAAVNSRLSQLG